MTTLRRFDVPQLSRLIESGLTAGQIAKRFSVSTPTVRAATKRLAPALVEKLDINGKAAIGRRGQYKCSVEEVLILRKKGFSFEDIAGVLGVTTQTIRNTFKRAK